MGILLRVSGFVVLLLGFAFAATAAASEEWESEAHNCTVVIPDTPASAAWTWLRQRPEWKAHRIIRGAQRQLDKLKDGKPAEGHGGLLHVAYRDAPAGKTLAQLTADKTVRAFLLARFGTTAADVEREEVTVLSGDQGTHPAIVLRTEGEANDLLGKKRRALGLLLITVARGKLYLLRAYVFPTEHDAEWLGPDLDWLETDSLILHKTKELPKPPPPKPEPAEAIGREEVLEDRVVGWRLTKPAKITQVDVAEEDRAADMKLRFEDGDAYGKYVVYLYVTPNTRVVEGRRRNAPDLGHWMSRHWWENFTATHDKGDIHTWTFPRRTFLTLPRMEEAKWRKGVITGARERPVVISLSDAMKRLAFVEKPKSRRLGAGRVSEAYRGGLEGRRNGIPGQETVFRFAWRDKAHTYRLLVTMYGQAYVKWGSSIRAMLESFEIGVRARARTHRGEGPGIASE